jgi:N-acetylmuramoyl-L-alanine amidase
MIPRIAIFPGHHVFAPGVTIHTPPLACNELALCRIVCERIDPSKMGWRTWQKVDPYPELAARPTNSEEAYRHFSLKHRIAWLNDQRLDAVVEVHLNSFTDPAVNYPCVLRADGPDSHRLANVLAEWLMARGFSREELCSVRARVDSPATVMTEEEAQAGRKALLREVQHPVVIVEAGFLSSDRFRDWIRRVGVDEFAHRYATAITDGVTRWAAA